MREAFLKYVANNNLFEKKDRVLIAVSGGVDSVVLGHLFHQSGLPFAVAHCNYKLRGEESDKDEKFVKKLAEKWDVPFFSTSFNTETIARNRKQSTQETARDLRYEWLGKTRQQADYQYIATAHHLNDSIETILYNFTKGCGIRGFHGILSKRGFLVRPLLFATKDKILAFAEKEKIAFREDASNATDKYVRNKIRRQVIPVLKALNPSFEKTAKETVGRIREVEKLYDYAIEILTKDIVEIEKDILKIDHSKLRSSPAPATLLFEIIKPFNFNKDQVALILQSIDNQSGKLFFSSNHQLLTDRENLIIKRKENSDGVKYFINKGQSKINFEKAGITLKYESGIPEKFPDESNFAFLDSEKLTFPLTLRHWQPGDYFHPLGMKGKRKKLQDFFSDLKLSRFEKEKVWILESGGQICWVVGHRIDESFKVNNQTKQCLVLEYKPGNFVP